MFTDCIVVLFFLRHSVYYVLSLSYGEYRLFYDHVTVFVLVTLG